nr:MAG TPA: hypothetical protein [Caudoviricetes sp.]
MCLAYSVASHAVWAGIALLRCECYYQIDINFSTTKES